MRHVQSLPCDKTLKCVTGNWARDLFFFFKATNFSLDIIAHNKGDSYIYHSYHKYKNRDIIRKNEISITIIANDIIDTSIRVHNSQLFH